MSAAMKDARARYKAAKEGLARAHQERIKAAARHEQAQADVRSCTLEEKAAEQALWAVFKDVEG